MNSEIITHGVVEKEVGDLHIENFQRQGFSVIKSVLSSDEVKETKECLKQVYKTQCDAVGGLDNLKKINEEGIVRSLFTYDDFFLKNHHE